MTVPSAWDYGKVNAIPLALAGGIGAGVQGYATGGVLDTIRDPNLFTSSIPKGKNIIARNRNAIIGGALGSLIGAGLLGGAGFLAGAGEGAIQNAYLGEDSGWLPWATGISGGALGAAGGSRLAKSLSPRMRTIAPIVGGVLGTVGGWSVGGLANRELPTSMQIPLTGAAIGAPLANTMAGVAGSKSRLPMLLGGLAGALMAKRLASKDGSGEDREE